MTYIYLFIDIINKDVLHKFIPDQLFKFLNWNVEQLEAAVAAAAAAATH